jgi:hypothetical protein
MADVTTSQPLWLRKVELVVGDANQTTIDLSQLQIRFDVFSANKTTARRLECRIYNPSPDTAQRIEKEFTYVQLSAGYENNPYGIIFAGRICRISRGKESAVDSYLDIVARDGDEPVTYGCIGVSIPPSQTSLSDQHAAVVKAMAKYGVSTGYVPSDLPTQQLPRGKVVYGMVRDKLRDIASTAKCDWHIEDNQVNLVPVTGIIPDYQIIIDESSGLVGVPTQTVDGLNLTTLLNPNIKTGRVILVPGNVINTTSFSQSLQPGQSEQPYIPDLSPTAQFKVWAVHHTGDTRGGIFYTDIVAEAIGGKNPVNSQARLDAVVNGQ